MVKRILSLALVAGICTATFSYSYADPASDEQANAAISAEQAAKQAAELAAIAETAPCAPIVVDGQALEKARQQVDEVIAKLSASGDLSAAGAEELKATLAAVHQDLSGLTIKGSNTFFAPANRAPGVEPMLNVAGVPSPSEFFVPADTGLGAYTLGGESAPPLFMMAKPTKLTIKLGKDTFTVDGENVDQERLDKIREKLKKGHVDLREGVSIELSPDGDTVTINGNDFNLPQLQGFMTPDAPQAWTVPQALENSQVYTVPGLSPEQREELEQVLKDHDPAATKQWAEELRQELEQQGVTPMSDPKAIEELSKELEQSVAPLSDPKAVEELLQSLPTGELNLQDGWESDVDGLSKQIKELVEQFIHEHQGEASAKDA